MKVTTESKSKMTKAQTMKVTPSRLTRVKESMKHHFADKDKRTKAYFICLIILVIAALVTVLYFYTQVKSLQSPSVKAQQETKSLVQEIGEVMVLPTDETPTLATVSDPSKLQDQTFFLHAQVGDKVLIYTRNKKAILYSPSLHKIIEVAPVSINANGAN